MSRRIAAELSFRDAGHGYDVFGMQPRAVATAIAACRFFHRHYFRVESRGLEHVPRSGAAILAANHSGMLPIDAAMLVTDVVLGTRPRRVPRAIGDVFIPLLPFVGTAFARAGMVSGSRTNVRHLLESGELVLVFPEGVPGIAKGFARRYQLAEFRVGHAELAIRHRVPVIPVGVVGAEESWPQIGRIERFHWFGAPFLPIPVTPLPLPVRYHVRYGPPLLLHERWPAEAADDPAVVDHAASLVRDAVMDLVGHALAERRGLLS